MLDGERFHFEHWRRQKGARAKPHPPQPDRPLNLEKERAVLAKLGLSKPWLDELERRAVLSGATLEQELLSDGRVREEAYYGALARGLGLEFIGAVPPALLADCAEIDTQLTRPQIVRCRRPDGSPLTVIVPELLRLFEERAQFERAPRLKAQFAVTTPSAMRAAVRETGRLRRAEQAAYGLARQHPESSAHTVLSKGQKVAAIVMLAAVFTALAFHPAYMVHGLHLVFSGMFCVMLLIRLAALKAGAPLNRRQSFPADLGPTPVYTVLAALYDEAAVASQLIERLDGLNWPRSRLDIKLLCEERDDATIAALKRLDLGPEYEVVVVPDIGPRTKPKALNYGLIEARGEFLVIYDAEDRPHPDQLIEAWHHFRAAPEIACFQSPLVIGNGGEGALPALFALEYSALFRRLLPFLADRGLPMPLGGTSNHVRTDVLRGVGGWDPYNVTEDADLGMRLHRAGHGTEMLTRPTVEDAPTRPRVWINQRSRWHKGWMQTWLAHMRHPLRLYRDLGARGFLAFQLVVTGQLASALAHPLTLALVASSIAHVMASEPYSPWEQALLAIDIANLLGSYLVFILMGWGAMPREESKRLGSARFFVPVYWLMMSWAAWKALRELRDRPFFWAKTPHEAKASPRRAGA
ncbi:cellulose synthase/poly-beta-1,6-N-acetylglucosamine synthase-like glycosyltransferase [Rhizobium sp. SG_E_25_P2]|uniref:glycosyltransferase family 2 protein n=1 Tax=Rhizobium sp. SG_E_25_P2 TaxID=2879942 RepID=UPI002472FC8A|nr:glycosyltransferase [Rhizobium sp. SG_E_25_P2]MDH6265710.1 cellulose synthase/poly-beta-1,6-N-acetylglucosamine synthase-like glycosyltransferase [Rhizobium sp. SG_E_25_P2]